MLTDAEISVAIADLDPEPKSPVATDDFECVYRETQKLINGLIKQAAETERTNRRREWALWIAAGVVVAAVVWGLQ